MTGAVANGAIDGSGSDSDSDTQQHPAPRVLSRRLTLGPDVCWCVCVCVVGHKTEARALGPPERD